MDKIAVKHYLNTNLRPYSIRGESYFPVYILVRARGRSTRVRSHLFSDVYTQSHFDSILDFPDKKLEAEAATISSIIEAQLIINKRDFDTHLFGVLYNLMPKYLLKEIYLPADIVQLMPAFDGISVYRWFNMDVQEKLKKALLREKINYRIMRPRYNAAIVYGFFKILSVVIPSNPNRYRVISATYGQYLSSYRRLAQRVLTSS